ncbi:hypothetical protein ASB57_03790 [Bordetella sp. N]|nr:hypothetical protein ASB57_03790 [Bordetella sp. N]
MVTGVTGVLGRATLQGVLRATPAVQIAGLARDPAKVADLAQLGIDIRRGDYYDSKSLRAAFRGITRLLFVSATAFSERMDQHCNVIQAAREAGVRHVIYTSIQRKPGSPLRISRVTESDILTEEALATSGMDYTILRNNVYLDYLPFMVGSDALTRGVRVPGGKGAAALVSRADLSEAAAAVLTQPGHVGKVYTLGAGSAFSLPDVASALTALSGHDVDYVNLSTSAFVRERVAAGMPEAAANFLSEWIEAIGSGEFEETTGDMERLIGRPPSGYLQFLRAAYQLPHSERD